MFKEERDPVLVPRRRPHGLADVHELGDGVLVVVAVLRVVLQDEVLERLPEIDLLRLLQAKGDHRNFGGISDDGKNKKIKL